MLKENYNTIETEKDLYKTKLEEFITLKEKHDKKMMSNFVLILNEKKKRIQHLNDLLDAFRNGREPKNLKSNVKINSKSKTVEDVENEETTSKRQRLEQISDSESDDYDTDDEKSNEAVIPETEPVPSTSKEYTSILADDDSSPERMIIEETESNDIAEDSGTKKVEEVYRLDTKRDKAPENKSSEINKTITDRESPTLEFNTQDLLDRL